MSATAYNCESLMGLLPAKNQFKMIEFLMRPLKPKINPLMKIYEAQNRVSQRLMAPHCH